MKNKILDFKVSSEIIKLSLPISLSFIGFQILGIVDVLMVGKIGVEAIAALGLVNTLFGLIVMPFEGLYEGMMIIFSRYFGSEKFINLKRSFKYAFVLSILICLLYFIVGLIFRLLLKKISPDELTLKYSIEYYDIMLFGLIFYSPSWLFGRFLISISKTYYIGIITNLTILINIILNYILIFGKFGFPALYIKGAAIATVIARFVLFLLLAIITFYYYRKLHIKNEDKSEIIDFKMFNKDVFKIGLPISMTAIIEILSWSIFVLIITRIGTIALASHECALRIKDFSMLPAAGISSILTSMVSRFVGMKDREKAILYCRNGVRLSVIIMGFFGLIFLLLPEFLLKLITNDKNLIRNASNLLRFMALYQVSDALFITYRASVNALGFTYFVRNTIFAAAILIWLPLSFLFSHIIKFGAIGAWIGLTVYVFVLGLVYRFKFYNIDWNNLVKAEDRKDIIKYEQYSEPK